MNAGATSERVYDALKRRLMSGDIVPGDKLDPAAFAQDLSSSVTPVRDALHRLTGERLVETRASEGFHLPIVTEPMLRDLYAWNGQLARSVVSSWPRHDRQPLADRLSIGIEQATPEFFSLFADRSDNVAHREQLDAINDRLGAARAAERKVLPDLEMELRSLAVAFDNDTTAVLLRLVTAYHRRRLLATTTIVRALYRNQA